MRRHCRITVKRPERRVDLTAAAEQQPCGVQVVEGVGLVASGYSIHRDGWKFQKKLKFKRQRKKLISETLR